jgi:hypothetical protein
MEKYSVVIPTMWKPTGVVGLLEKISASDLVEEILIISNAKGPELPQNNKFRLLQQDNNLGVNLSWNLGVSESKNNKICIVNDDVDFDIKVFDFLNDKITQDIGLIGVCLEEDLTGMNLIEMKQRSHGFGCLFFIHKNNYVNIPKSLKIFFGDDWLFNLNLKNKNYCIKNIGFKTEISTTSKLFNHVVTGEQDNYFREMYAIGKEPIKYSIIVPHYDQVISDEVLSRGLTSLINQEYSNFEILLYHDGPMNRTLRIPKSDKIKVFVTNKRMNDWGHSLRNLGIGQSSGDYILHFNPDNILYPNALKEITETIVDTKYRKHNTNIIIFPIYLMGYTALGDRHIRLQGEEDNIKIPLVGNPAIMNYIDCMQLVMKKYIWHNYGGWYDKSFAGDGVMYERFVKENRGARYCSNILGEHR